MTLTSLCGPLDKLYDPTKKLEEHARTIPDKEFLLFADQSKNYIVTSVIMIYKAEWDM